MTITDIQLALANLNEVQREHDKALAGYEGHSWGYFGFPYQQAIEKAKQELDEALTAYIEFRVEAMLERKAARS